MTPFVPISIAEYKQSLLERIQAAFPGTAVIGEGAPMEDAPFSVTEEYALGDLSEVKDDVQVLPVSSNVLFRVNKGSTRVSRDGSIKSLSLDLRLVEGINMPQRDGQGNLTGVIEKRYINKPMFVDLPYWVDTAIRTKERYTGKNQSFKVPLKQFLMALGYPINPAPSISDGFFSEIVGRELRADITHREIQVKSPISGVYEGTGDYRNEVRRFRGV